MTREEINAVLEQISYKPGWLLEWDWLVVGGPIGGFGRHHTLQIRWHLHVPDAYDHDKMVFFTSAWIVPHWDHLDEESLVRDVWRLTQRAELHEAGEFFMYEDQRPFDPHKSVLEEGVRFG